MNGCIPDGCAQKLPKMSSKSVCSRSGGISFTRADYTEEGSGGNFRTPEDFARAMSGLSMYPEVCDLSQALTLLVVARALSVSHIYTCLLLSGAVNPQACQPDPP